MVIQPFVSKSVRSCPGKITVQEGETGKFDELLLARCYYEAVRIQEERFGDRTASADDLGLLPLRHVLKGNSAQVMAWWAQTDGPYGRCLTLAAQHEGEFSELSQFIRAILAYK
ncbi:MAG: hypothetical protein GX101_06990 [Firmicutes bacterium]|nr:hypothetical protein [Bacillota bacterium]